MSQDEEFSGRVLDCIDEINRMLPSIVLREEPLVVVAALSQYVGETLQLSMSERICTLAQARRVFQHVEHTAMRPT